ncbi:MAG TPA: FAD/NAD(P)-binding protein [Telluria sp.]|jgi:uncharacterized NAD(P)/FAD-binding protein YdhS
MVRYCIIGTGFSGTCMLWHLVDALCRQAPADGDLRHIDIATVERRPRNGPGLPYDADEVAPYHLCNNPAEKMSLFGNDFVNWMLAHRDELVRLHPDLIRAAHPTLALDQWQPQAAAFYPRALFGIYLSMRFDEACALAESRGATIRHYNGVEAIDGLTRDGRFHLTIRDVLSGQLQILARLDKVLLASGHWEDAGRQAPRMLASPYPAREVHRAVAAMQERQPKQSLTLGVRGMGPSAVDAILSLCDGGLFELDADGLATRFLPCWDSFQASEVSIVASSRSGFFPGVRWPLVDYAFAHLTDENMAALRARNGGRIDLTALLALIDRELRAASHDDLDLATVFRPRFAGAYQKLTADARGAMLERLAHTVILRARRLRFYQDLSAADKRIYDTELDTHFIRTAVPLPLQNARKLMALIEAGVLSTVALGYDAQAAAPAALPGPAADLVICSHGQNYDLDRHPSLLIQHLLERKEVVAYSEDGYRTGGIGASEASLFRVQNALGGRTAYSAHLYSFGPITQYWQNQNNFAAAFVSAAQVVAQDWLAGAAGQADGAHAAAQCASS